VIFDLGAVVLEWAPQLPFEQVLPADEVPGFMAKIDFWGWNRTNDTGRTFEVGEQLLIDRFPESADAIRAYREHFAHSLTGMVPGTGAVIAELQQAGVRLLALTNWSAETFPHARRRFGILTRVEDIVVSGTELVAKPDPAIFELIVARHGLDPADCVFIDDSPANVAAAAELGITAVQFTDATQLRSDLSSLGLIGESPAVTQPIFHLTARDLWLAAQRDRRYPWSSRDLSYLQQGFVHCSFAHQVAGVADRIYAGVDPTELVVLELDLRGSDVPVVDEDLDAGEAFPHLYAELPLELVVAVHELGAFSAHGPLTG
jgi:2-haloacid dehalogenase